MVTKKKKISRLTKELLATAKDMRDVGVMSKETYEKVTLRHLGDAPNVIRRKGIETI